MLQDWMGCTAILESDSEMRIRWHVDGNYPQSSGNSLCDFNMKVDIHERLLDDKMRTNTYQLPTYRVRIA